MNLTSESLAIAKEVLSLAGTETTLTEYKQDSLLRRVELGTSHDDRLRMIDFLLVEGLIRERDDKVQLIRGTIPDWLVEFASQGTPDAFTLVDILDPEENWGMKKFDEAVLKQIGLQGEIAFIDWLNSSKEPPKELLHVSLFDDTLGYDVRVTSKEGIVTCYEVKTSSRPATKKFQFYLSRNEYQVSSALGGWKLACMQVTSGAASFIGFCPSGFIQDNMPKDTSEQATWAVAKANVPIATLEQL
jgi:hypothetical protein